MFNSLKATKPAPAKRSNPIMTMGRRLRQNEMSDLSMNDLLNEVVCSDPI